MGKMREHFRDVARRALAAYGLANSSLALIRHSDNVTYKVRGPHDDAYLLRLHIPVTGAMGAHGADEQSVASELLWLEALNRDTDLVLQQPVRNRVGALVTQIQSKYDTQSINCTLLRWLDGRPYHRDLETRQTAFQIGTFLAKLHRHASRWEIPEGFKRPKRDAAYFAQVLRALQPALQDGRISPAHFAEFETSVALLLEMLGSQVEQRQTDGIMHADAHKGNLLYHDGAIRLIDFSFCASGNFMFDLGVCLSDMKESLHPAFLAGYQSERPLPANYQRLAEGFFVGSMIGTFSYWVANPQAQAILVQKVPVIAQSYAARFHRGESFWFSRPR